MDFLEYLGDQKWIPTGTGKNNLDKTISRYFLKKSIALEKAPDNVDSETKKYYSFLDIMSKDGRYKTKNLETYVRTFNLTSEIPDFMKPWIKNEYKKYLALKQSTETLQIGINKRYSREIRGLISEYEPEKESIFVPFTLRVGIDQLFVDKEFFDNMEYVLFHSEFDPPVESLIHKKISEWKESFDKIYKQYYREIHV